MSSPAEPSLPRAIRATLPAGAPRRVLLSSLVWAGMAGLTSVGMSQLPGLDTGVGFACALSVGLGMVGTRRLAGALGVLGVALSALGARWLGISPELTAGATMGVIAVGLAQGPGLVYALQGAFAGAAVAALGARLAWLLPTAGLPPMASQAAQGLILGAVAAQVLWLGAIVWISSDRLPSMRVVEANLPENLRGPVRRAHELDRALAPQCADPETRDGLGEVAAWVYRLSWTQAALGRELKLLEADRLEGRLAEARRVAAEAADALTREPREATARHLEQLVAHRDAIRLEQERTGALIEYALAFLEQARAGLALARVRPGEGMPDRLGDVLTRLRSQTAEGDARRRTTRQLTPLA